MNEIEEAVATCLQVYDMANNSDLSEYIDAPEGFIAALDGLGFIIIPNDLLIRIEWIQQKWNGTAECPWCHNYRNDGHAFGCKLASAISRNS